jgi:hypothetical protein
MVPRRLSPTATSASSPDSGITQRRYGGDRNRAKVGEDERGAGPFLHFQRLYLASGGIHLDRSRVHRRGNPRRGFIPQNLPLLLIGCSRLALIILRLSLTHVPSRWASSSTPEEHSRAVLALPVADMSAIRSDSENIYSVRVYCP